MNEEEVKLESLISGDIYKIKEGDEPLEIWNEIIGIKNGKVILYKEV